VDASLVKVNIDSATGPKLRTYFRRGYYAPAQ